jgi:ribosomal protein S1
MKKEEKNFVQESEFGKLLEKNELAIPAVGDHVHGVVLAASKSEVRLDLNGVRTGVVRGPELYLEADEYAKLKVGDEIDAIVIEQENENGDAELSFRLAGQEKAWDNLREAFHEKKNVKVRVVDGNKGGLLVRFRQISGFLPVSQLAPENYPRVAGGDKGKILEKLKSFVGRDFEAKVMTLDEGDNKIIFSEKEAWSETQKDVISQYQIGTIVEGKVTAVTDFGVFISFGDGMEGLIHISELAWKRIDNPSDLYKVGDEVKAEIINISGSKIFLSAKKLQEDPWVEVSKKYSIGQIVKGKILKVNPFGLFVELDELIHGLAHISQLNLAAGVKIEDLYKSGAEMDFEIFSIEPKEHRLGLIIPDTARKRKPKNPRLLKLRRTRKKKKARRKRKSPRKLKKRKKKPKTRRKIKNNSFRITKPAFESGFCIAF